MSSRYILGIPLPSSHHGPAQHPARCKRAIALKSSVVSEYMICITRGKFSRQSAPSEPFIAHCLIQARLGKILIPRLHKLSPTARRRNHETREYIFCPILYIQVVTNIFKYPHFLVHFEHVFRHPPNLKNICVPLTRILADGNNNNTDW